VKIVYETLLQKIRFQVFSKNLVNIYRMNFMYKNKAFEKKIPPTTPFKMSLQQKVPFFVVG